MQPLAVQQASNAQLLVQAQQSQAVQMAHTDVLRALNESTQQRTFDHIFTSIPVFDGTNKEKNFKLVQMLESACLHSR